MRTRTVCTRDEKKRWGAGALTVIIVSVLALFSTIISASLMDEKLNLERSIQERAEHLVEKIIGSKNMVVLVNVELESEAAEGQGGYVGTNFTEQEYLPGITYSNIPAQTNTKATTIKRINVVVTLDEAASAQVSEQVKKELFEVLGLNAVRNDSVTVKKIPFAKEPEKGWKDYAGAFSVQLYWLIALILFTIFLFGPLRSFFRSIAQTKVNIDASNLKAGDLASAMGGAIGMPKLTLALEKEGEHNSKHFTFVNEMNVQNLIFLLKGESKEKVAVALNFLPPGYASEVFAALDPATQSFVAATLTEKKLLQQTDVFMVEEEVKQRIDYLTGGVEHFLNLMEHLDVRTQETIMGRLEKERPEVSKRVRNAMFMFKDIMLLDKPALLKLVRTAQGKNLSFATALSKASPEMKDKVIQALPEGAQAILSEEIRLTGDVSEVRVSEEQRAIARLGRLLEKAGEISINRGGLAGGGGVAALGSGEGEAQTEKKEVVEAEALPPSSVSEPPVAKVPDPVEDPADKDAAEPAADEEIGQNGFFVDVEDAIKKKHEIIAASQEQQTEQQTQMDEENKEEIKDKVVDDIASAKVLKNEEGPKGFEKKETSIAASADENRKERDGDIIEFPRVDTVQKHREVPEKLFFSNGNKDITAETTEIQVPKEESSLKSREERSGSSVSTAAGENQKEANNDILDLPKIENTEHETSLVSLENGGKKENIENGNGRIVIETAAKTTVENDRQEIGQSEQAVAVGEQSVGKPDGTETDAVKPVESNNDQGNEPDLGSFWLKRLSESHKNDQVD